MKKNYNIYVIKIMIMNVNQMIIHKYHQLLKNYYHYIFKIKIINLNNYNKNNNYYKINENK